MRFPYREYHITPSPDFPDGVLSRPEVPLHVIGPAGVEILLALVDTGADTTVLPRWTQSAIAAAIDETQASTVSGIAGQELAVVPGEVELALEQGGETYRWKTRVEFASEDSLDAAAILGHAGCLRHFVASFNGQSLYLELLPTADFPGSVTPTSQ
jgi:hypothetical protein